MTNDGNPYENAEAERIYGILKQGLLFHRYLEMVQIIIKGSIEIATSKDRIIPIIC